MSWPTTITGTLTNGIRADGVSTIHWGTYDVLSTVNGLSVTGGTIAIVTRANQRTLAENIKLPNGDGVTTTRIQIVDGEQWDVTIRADNRLDSNTPKVGTKVLVADLGGHLGTVGAYITCRVIESGFDTAPKQAGERTISIEKLALITES
jgi:hypothetical protein